MQKKDNIKVSIILPSYNVEKYLPKCLDSAINSTLREIEIIAVDDGAKDSTGKIIDEYAQKDSRVIAIHKTNGGYGTAVNAGLKIAQGKYVAILETDDWVAPSMYEILFQKAEEFQADCIKGNFYHCPAENENIPHHFFDSLPIEKMFKLEEHPEILLLAPSIWSALYKREFLESKNIKCVDTVTPYEDLPFAYEVYSKTDKILLVDMPLYFYRCEPKQGSSTIRSDRKLFNIIAQIKNTIKILKDNYTWEFSKEATYKHIYNAMVLFVGNAHKSLKKELFLEFRNLVNNAQKDNIKYLYFQDDERKMMKYLVNGNFFKYEYNKLYRYIKHHPTFFLRKDFWDKIKNREFS